MLWLSRGEGASEKGGQVSCAEGLLDVKDDEGHGLSEEELKVCHACLKLLSREAHCPTKCLSCSRTLAASVLRPALCCKQKSPVEAHRVAHGRMCF